LVWQGSPVPVPRLILIGPPGAGKGTQAVWLAIHLGVPHLSTGELLRAAVRQGSRLGERAKTHMDAGKLVPDDLVLQILEERLREPDARTGFVLDGYPRNRAQARTLAGITELDRVIAFEIPEGMLFERLTQRRNCPTCGRTYNLATMPPRNDARCDVDGSKLLARSDDAPEAVRTRLKVWAEQTTPLIEYYRERGLLRTVDAHGSREEVADRLRRAVADA
jgi:adenylate kinase